MTNIEKTTALKSLLDISDASEDGLIGIYLSLSMSEIINWKYSLSTSSDLAEASDSEGNSIGLKVNIFYEMAKPDEDTIYTFVYSESDAGWLYESEVTSLKKYGIVYNSQPVDGETITVDFCVSNLSQYDTLQIMACIAGYNLNGAENQTADSEIGKSRTFKYSDMLAYIHAMLVPYCGIV